MISWDTKSLAMSYLNSDKSFLFPQTRDSVIVLKASMIWDLFEEVASLFDERKEMVFLDGLYLKDSAECSDIFNFKLETFSLKIFSKLSCNLITWLLVKIQSSVIKETKHNLYWSASESGLLYSQIALRKKCSLLQIKPWSNDLITSLS